MSPRQAVQSFGRTAAALAILLLLIPTSTAATNFGLASNVGADTIIPVTLAAGNNCNGQCTTTLNPAATSATVGPLNILPNPSQQRQVVKVLHGAQAWSVQLRVLGTSSMAATDSITFGLSSTAAVSMPVTLVTPLPATSNAVPLASGGSAADVTLTARGTCAATCVVTAELLISSGKASYTYSVTLTVT